MAAPSYVSTIARVAEMLGEDEEWPSELAEQLEPEDGCLWIRASTTASRSGSLHAASKASRNSASIRSGERRQNLGPHQPRPWPDGYAAPRRGQTFFPCHSPPVEEAPQRANAGGHTGLVQLGPDLPQRDVGLLVDEAEDQRCMRLNLRRVTVPAERPWRDRPRRPHQRRPTELRWPRSPRSEAPQPDRTTPPRSPPPRAPASRPTAPSTSASPPMPRRH